MEDALIALLEALKYPVYRQGSMSDKEAYPPTFITFWNTGSPDHAHYNNDNYGTVWSYNVYVYSTDPSVIYTVIAAIRSSLKAAGWSVPSQGQDVASDYETHTGRSIECSYLAF